MPSKLPQFNIRTEQEIFDKISYIAEQNSRSANKEIVYIIKKHIEQYEKEHGTIEIEKGEA